MNPKDVNSPCNVTDVWQKPDHWYRVWINFSMVICEKSGVMNATGGSVGAVIPLPTAALGKNLVAGPEKFDFYYSKGRRLAYYFFTFYVKFSAAWGIFV